MSSTLRKELPHAIGLALGAAAGAVITAAFTIGLALVRLTDSSDKHDWPTCEHGWLGTSCGQAHPYVVEPTSLKRTP